MPPCHDVPRSSRHRSLTPTHPHTSDHATRAEYATTLGDTQQYDSTGGPFQARLRIEFVFDIKTGVRLLKNPAAKHLAK